MGNLSPGKASTYTGTTPRRSTQSASVPLGDQPSIVTSEITEKMSYLNAVCREVLRLFPPVAMTIRVAVKDTAICGQPVPQDTIVMLPPWAVNGSIELWGSGAADFKPERWQRGGTDPASDNRSTNYGFLTFLHGPRSCIGQSFAIGEFACLLAAWIGAFDTHLQDPDMVPIVRGSITAKPKDGLHVRIRPVVNAAAKLGKQIWNEETRVDSIIGTRSEMVWGRE